MLIMLNILKRSIAVYPSLSNFNVQSSHHHHLSSLFKITEFRQSSIRSFQTTNLRFSDEESKDKGKTRLDEVAENLSVDIASVFINKINLDNYHPELEVDDRLKGVHYRGLLLYIKDQHLTKIKAHINYPYVRPQILNLVKLEQEKAIKVDWRYVGLTTLRMLLRYIPDKLWYRANMDKAAIVWSQGSSTHFLDDDFKIYKIVVDKVIETSEVDKEKPKPKISYQQKI